MRWKSESLAAVVAATAAALVSFDAIPPLAAVFSTAFAALVAIAAAHDIRAYRLPDPVNAAIFLLGMGFVALDTEIGGIGEARGRALLRAAIAGGLLLGLRALYERLRGRTGLGLGDVKLIAASAAWLSPEALAWGVLLAALAALLATVWTHVARRADVRLGEALIPFGAFLGPAFWLVWYAAQLGFAPG